MIILVLTSTIAFLLLCQAYMTYRAKKLHEFCLTDEGRTMTIEKANKIMRQFWKWPIKPE